MQRKDIITVQCDALGEEAQPITYCQRLTAKAGSSPRIICTVVLMPFSQSLAESEGSHAIASAKVIGTTLETQHYAPQPGYIMTSVQGLGLRAYMMTR
jgi:hypothetical protein